MRLRCAQRCVAVGRRSPAAPQLPTERRTCTQLKSGIKSYKSRYKALKSTHRFEYDIHSYIEHRALGPHVSIDTNTYFAWILNTEGSHTQNLRSMYRTSCTMTSVTHQRQAVHCLVLMGILVMCAKPMGCHGDDGGLGGALTFMRHRRMVRVNISIMHRNNTYSCTVINSVISGACSCVLLASNREHA